DVLDLLTRLVDKSLVVVDGGDHVAWYRLLEPVRQYAELQLTTSGETAAARDRHAAWYLALADEAAAALHGPQQAAWWERLEREQGNVRAALRWTEEAGASDVRLRLATALVPFWEAHGHIGEGRRWLLAALAAETSAVAPTLRVRALLGAGRLAFFYADGAGSRYAEAERLQTEGLTLARAVADR